MDILTPARMSLNDYNGSLTIILYYYAKRVKAVSSAITLPNVFTRTMRPLYHIHSDLYAGIVYMQPPQCDIEAYTAEILCVL